MLGRTLGGAGAETPEDVTIVGSPLELAERSDVLSVHLLALTPETRSLVDSRILGRLRPGSSLVNTARAEVIDQGALADAIRTRGVKVGLDVRTAEPAHSQGTFHDPLIALPGVVGTHHIGASTDQAQQAIAQEVVRLIHHWRRHDHDHPHS